jgi:hypothetical protein
MGSLLFFVIINIETGSVPTFTNQASSEACDKKVWKDVQVKEIKFPVRLERPSKQ